MEKSEDRVTKWSVLQNKECELCPKGSSVPWEVLWRGADLRKSGFEKNNLGAMDKRVWGRRG